MILKPQHLRIFGSNIHLGDFVTIICASDKKIDLSTWQTDKLNGELHIGGYVLMSPGINIRCAKKITIGKSTMIASDVTITDSDWHGIYDRTDYVANPKEISIGENVWIGERSLILKGSKIGNNSIIGAEISRIVKISIYIRFIFKYIGNYTHLVLTDKIFLFYHSPS
jgi:acetyltransferase-like isoleucine patch superfamily enzyme